MKRIFLFFMAVVVMSSCGNNQQQSDQRSQDSAVINIDTLSNTESAEKDAAEEDTYAYLNDTMTAIPAGRKIRYLFYTNGGLTGCYNDSTVAQCPRCDLCIESIESLNKRNPHGRYIADALAISISWEDGMKDKIAFATDHDNAQEWAMLDYKWQQKIDSCGGE